MLYIKLFLTIFCINQWPKTMDMNRKKFEKNSIASGTVSEQSTHSRLHAPITLLYLYVSLRRYTYLGDNQFSSNYIVFPTVRPKMNFLVWEFMKIQTLVSLCVIFYMHYTIMLPGGRPDYPRKTLRESELCETCNYFDSHSSKYCSFHERSPNSRKKLNLHKLRANAGLYPCRPPQKKDKICSPRLRGILEKIFPVHPHIKICSHIVKLC